MDDKPGICGAPAYLLCRRFLFLTGDTLSPETRSFLGRVEVPRLTKSFTAAEVRRAVAEALEALRAQTINCRWERGAMP